MQTAEIIELAKAKELPQEHKMIRATVAADCIELASDKLELAYPRIAYTLAALVGIGFWWGVFVYF